MNNFLAHRSDRRRKNDYPLSFRHAQICIVLLCSTLLFADHRTYKCADHLVAHIPWQLPKHLTFPSTPRTTFPIVPGSSRWQILTVALDCSAQRWNYCSPFYRSSTNCQHCLELLRSFLVGSSYQIRCHCLHLILSIPWPDSLQFRKNLTRSSRRSSQSEDLRKEILYFE